MKTKTFCNSEKDFYKSFIKQFDGHEKALSAWDMIDKPSHYPCVVVRSCGKYFFVYEEDFL